MVRLVVFEITLLSIYPNLTLKFKYRNAPQCTICNAGAVKTLLLSFPYNEMQDITKQFTKCTMALYLVKYSISMAKKSCLLGGGLYVLETHGMV